MKTSIHTKPMRNENAVSRNGVVGLSLEPSIFLVFFACLELVLPLKGFSQLVPPTLDPSGRSGEPPALEKQIPPKPIPPPERILPPPPAIDPSRQRLPLIRVFIKDIQVIGSTVFTQEELDEVIAPYVNRELTTEDLQKIRQALTLLYVNKGYINSGAVLPDQTVQDGVVTIQIIEGELTDVQVEGTKHFFPFYLESRIRLSAGTPLNIYELRKRLQLLLQDRRFKRVNAELKPGLKPGQSILLVKVEEASPYKMWTDLNNFQSPTVGAERGSATISHQNLIGLGDIFTVTYGKSDGLDPQFETSYLLPLSPWDTTLLVQYRKNDFAIVEAPFDTLNLKSESEIVHFSIRQPLYRTLEQELAVSLGFERLRSQIFLSNVGTNIFTPGAKPNGESVVSALRFVQEWTNRQRQDVMALRSQMSWGIDILDATNNGGSLPDTQFFSWQGQAQWAHRFDPSGIQLLSRMILQYANDRLFPLEQSAVGGRYSVRGYRENQLVRDNAFVFSVETRIPLLPGMLGPVNLQFAPFLDVGRAWVAKGVNPDPETLASVGLGLRASIFDRAHFSIYWGLPLNHVPTTGGNLQDDGIHLQLVVNVLD
ncbi:ShlB/FhaC/HecB family hemolysin secretion/activation protein [Candidatus Nitronereus thalassa]|uniref:ShlB/FhaC/HecB family hemolysin secretion/activation protein n=1 Tax=Candidatus Nitronereus thalassa TaxID=3020898 RepID=A0ABU3K9H9_9BACT|nr:ShlB/FhaC/HecB family hemolysin secretion/activation protein [Candidatus Nitronereus thalassa]MDT7043027.1 ShlB/FhaC/HecB family hemolysin secretion/activation protein [Candidatus Nitronereus thalassa]